MYATLTVVYELKDDLLELNLEHCYTAIGDGGDVTMVSTILEYLTREDLYMVKVMIIYIIFVTN